MTPPQGDTVSAHAGIATGTAEGTTDAARQGIRLIRRLVVINLGLVALQALSAGFFLSGYASAVTIHRVVAQALQLCALIQAIAALVQWRQRRVASRVAAISIGLFVIVCLEVAFGYRRWHWLHVPIGVGLFSGLTRQVGRLKEQS